MSAQPAFGFKELLVHLIADMAKAVSERNGEATDQRHLRVQSATHMILGFFPRDVIEAMLAGRCVMFHELMVDSVRDTLRGELDTMRRATRSNIVAMDKCFTNNLTRLERYQTRPSLGTRDVPEVSPAPAETAAPQAAETPAPAKQREPAPRPAAPRQTEAQAAAVTVPPDVTTPLFAPSPEAIAACCANPEAMAALEANDAVGFARAMGIDMPSEAYLAEAAQPGPFTRSSGPNARDKAVPADYKPAKAINRSDLVAAE